MKGIIILASALLSAMITTAQVASMRVVQASYSAVDPDAAGPANGSVVFKFEIMASAVILADGIGLSVAFQSANLMETPTNTVVPLGPLAVAVATGWMQQVDGRSGIDIGPPIVSYGGRDLDKRMVVSFNMPPNGTLMTVPTVWAPYCQVTYWTKSSSTPEGGYVINEPGVIAANNEISSDGGLTIFPMQSLNLHGPAALGSAVAPVLFSRFDAGCTNTATVISWTTQQEINSNRFELEKSDDGISWINFSSIPAAGNSALPRNYQQIDLGGGAAALRAG